MSIRTILQSLVIVGSMAGATSAVYAADCGQPPTQPEIPNGETVSREKLVEASEAVKQYIADADAYLDCREKPAKNKEKWKSMSKEEKVALKKEVSDLTKKRNAIGEQFNAEVEKFRKANMGDSGE